MQISQLVHHLNYYHVPSYQIQAYPKVQPVGSFSRALHVARRSIVRKDNHGLFYISRLSVKNWDRGGSGAGHCDTKLPPAVARRRCHAHQQHRQQHQFMTMPPTLDADSPTRHPSDDEYGAHRGGVGNDDDDDDDEFEPSRETDDEEEIGMSGQYVFMCRESNSYDE